MNLLFEFLCIFFVEFNISTEKRKNNRMLKTCISNFLFGYNERNGALIGA